MSERVDALVAARAALEARDGGRPVAIVLVADAAETRRMLVYDDETVGSLGDPALDDLAAAFGRELLLSGAAATRRAGEAVLYGEAHAAPETLLIVGAGHIAVPLAQLGVLLGFRVVVLDDREEFATTERFPAAADVRRVEFPDALRDMRVGPRDSVILVTRAHKYDFDVLSTLVQGDVVPRYIGMVGSRRRVRAAFGALLEAGVPRARLERVYAPIGIDIGAETPEEIAVSVAAELVAVRRGVASGASLREKERVLERLLPGE